MKLTVREKRGGTKLWDPRNSLRGATTVAGVRSGNSDRGSGSNGSRSSFFRRRLLTVAARAMKLMAAITPPRMGSRTLPLAPAEHPGAVEVLTFNVVDPGNVVVTLRVTVVEVDFP